MIMCSAAAVLGGGNRPMVLRAAGMSAETTPCLLNVLRRHMSMMAMQHAFGLFGIAPTVCSCSAAFLLNIRLGLIFFSELLRRRGAMSFDFDFELFKSFFFSALFLDEEEVPPPRTSPRRSISTSRMRVLVCL